MGTTLVIITVGVGVAALISGIAFMFRGVDDSPIEDRLEFLTGTGTAGKKVAKAKEASLLAHAMNRERKSMIEEVVSKFLNLRRFLDQADLGILPAHFVMMSLALVVVGCIASKCAGVHLVLAPLIGFSLGSLPLVWCFIKRKRRFAAFQKQLPDALELIGRALRAGHSLAAGFKLVADETSPPLGKEFGRVYEEQNLGVPLDDALENMSNRIPNLDLRFFSTAVILQRQTGGDLAEILDKIGRLIRDRFRIWGQIQALTGEGRISGIVLLGLPPVLFAAIYYLNSDYIELLFVDPLGKKMLAVAIVLQLLGALVIKKIINIKV